MRKLMMAFVGMVVLGAWAFPPANKEAAKALKVTKGKSFESGMVFVDGKFIEPPYVVERYGNVIRINKIPVTGEIIPWVEFLKTQEGVKQTKAVETVAAPTVAEPPKPAEPPPAVAPAAAQDQSGEKAVPHPDPNQDDRAWTMLNMDCNYYENCNSEGMMNLESLERHVAERLEGTKVTHFFINPNGMVACYPSKVVESCWVKQPWLNFEPLERKWIQNCKTLFDRGIDRYAQFVRLARKFGAEGWISMRMNDVHGVDNRDSQNCAFWHDHPEYWRVPKAEEKGNKSWFARAFDYSYREVREHHIAMANEMFDLWDMDGFDADWTRFAAHLTPGKERKQARFLTEVMRAIRERANRAERERGHRIYVAASIGSDPEANLSAGMDAVTWAKEGLIDVLIIGNFWTCVDFDTPYAEWVKLIHAVNPKVRVMVRADTAVHQKTRFDLDVYGWRGYWDNMLAQGCRDFGFFNVFEAPVTPRGQVIMKEGISRESVGAGPRKYFVTYVDIGGEGFNRRVQLPRRTDERGELLLKVGTVDDVDKVRVEVTFAKKATNRVGLKLNGTAPTELTAMDADGCFYSADFPVSALKAGKNRISYSSISGNELTYAWIVVTPKRKESAL